MGSRQRVFQDTGVVTFTSWHTLVTNTRNWELGDPYSILVWPGTSFWLGQVTILFDHLPLFKKRTGMISALPFSVMLTRKVRTREMMWKQKSRYTVKGFERASNGQNLSLFNGEDEESEDLVESIGFQSACGLFSVQPLRTDSVNYVMSFRSWQSLFLK